MQTTGYIYNKRTGRKILLLVRQCSYYRALKIRKSGKDGVHFSDEENHLNEPEQKMLLGRLEKGEVIGC